MRIIIGDEELSSHLELLELRRDVASLWLSCRLYHGKCSRELINLVPFWWDMESAGMVLLFRSTRAFVLTGLPIVVFRCVLRGSVAPFCVALLTNGIHLEAFEQGVKGHPWDRHGEGGGECFSTTLSFSVMYKNQKLSHDRDFNLQLWLFVPGSIPTELLRLKPPTRILNE